MTDKTQTRNSGKTIIFLAVLLLFLLFWMSVTTFGQTTDNSRTDNQTAAVRPVAEKSSAPVLKPVLQNYKSVAIGMSAKEVRDKVGKPEISDDQSIYYRFNDEESAQFVLDKDKKVHIISMMYFDKNNKAPKVEDVFGAGTTVEPNADGSIYKMVRYPDAGYVVVYSRAAGDNPTTVITMQKI